MSVQPVLAEKCEANGNEWIITLKDGIKFSNGNPVTAEVVIKNIQRVASVNERFSYFGEYTYKYVDDKTFSVFCPEVYPILPNDLASPEFGIIDIDHITDCDKAIIGTGPFTIKEFIPEGDVTVEKNANYWGGEVKLDGAKFFYMQEDEPKLMAMQSGEIQGYDSVTADAFEIFQKDPSKYALTDIPGTRLQFYILNKNRLSDNVRKAINGTVDKQAIADYLKGTVSPAVGPFNTSAAYGKVNGTGRLHDGCFRLLRKRWPAPQDQHRLLCRPFAGYFSDAHPVPAESHRHRLHSDRGRRPGCHLHQDRRLRPGTLLHDRRQVR